MNCFRCWKPWCRAASRSSSSRKTPKAKPSPLSSSTVSWVASGSRPSKRLALAIAARPCCRTLRFSTGGQAISEDLGIKMENVTLAMNGRAKKVMIDKENTTIVSGAGKKADIEVARVNQIKATSMSTSDYDRGRSSRRSG